MRRVVLDPVTRVEGHGVAEVFLDAAGEVAGARLAIGELRGFERICLGRPVEEMPRLTSRICGMCPAAHHVAAAKALDDLWEVDPSPAARNIRELAMCAQLIQSHLTHFYALALPDLMGQKWPVPERHLFRLMEELGPDLSRYILESRGYAGQLLSQLGGKGIHPEFALAGGVSRTLSTEEMYRVEALARSLVSFARFSLGFFKEQVLAGGNRISPETPGGEETHYLAMLSGDAPHLTEGELVLLDPGGREVERFGEAQYQARLVAEREPWSYAEFFYLTGPGGQRLAVQVGPLARVNAARRWATPLAQEAFAEMLAVLGPKPLRGPLAKHWARLVEALFAAERALELAHDYQPPAVPAPALPAGLPGSGLGVVEAPRGLLFHRYETDTAGLVTAARIITPTAVNQAAISGVMRAAAQQALAHGGEEAELAAEVETAIRSFDPCLSCATHIVRSPMTAVRLKRAGMDGSQGEMEGR